MIGKGNTHNSGTKLAAYMTTAKPGEHAELHELRGFISEGIKDAFRDVQIMSCGTQCEKPFFHLQVRNPEGETLTSDQWERVADRMESKLGLSGQPRAVAFHINDDTGDKHMHVAWSRIDEETMTAKALPFFKERLKEVSRELENELGLTPVTSQRRGEVMAPSRNEDEQARRLNVDIREVRGKIRECWEQSDNGGSFAAALANEGLTLAKGDRRDFVVIDPEGGMHALGKRVLGTTAAETRARMVDVDRESLPTVEQVREQIADRKPGITHAGGIAWEDALAEAAIAKEKIERRFDETAPARGAAKTPKPEPELKEDAANIRLAYNLSDSANSFTAALKERGIVLASVSKEEADRSHREAAFAKEVGNYAKTYREGEIVAVNQRGHVYQLTAQTTGDSRAEVEKFLGPLDRSQLAGIEATRDTVRETMRREAAAQKPERELSESVASIRQAFAGNDNAASFAAALAESGIKLAVVSHDEAAQSKIDHNTAAGQGRYLPEFRSGEIVAVNNVGYIHRLNEDATGNNRATVGKFLEDIDRSQLDSVEVTQHAQMMESRAFIELTQVGSLALEKDGRPDDIGGTLAAMSELAADSLEAAPVAGLEVVSELQSAIGDALKPLAAIAALFGDDKPAPPPTKEIGEALKAQAGENRRVNLEHLFSEKIKHRDEYDQQQIERKEAEAEQQRKDNLKRDQGRQR